MTAGLDSVGLRMPANDIALALIREAGVPLAAPSANRFTELSPTRAEHVRKSLGDRVDIILDGGPTRVGIESTVLSLREGRAELLRPGTITRAEIEAVIGPLVAAVEEDGHRSPGLHVRHYQPKTPMLLVDAAHLPEQGRGAFLSWSTSGDVPMPRNALDYARRLYEVLHDLDARGLDWVAVEPVPADAEWDGVRDRLTRAAQR